MSRTQCAILVWVLGATATVAAPSRTPFAPAEARADDEPRGWMTREERQAAARAAAEDLSSADDAVVHEAARRLAEVGYIGAQEVARREAELGDRAWAACSEAFVESKCSSCALPFATAARRASPERARRLLELAHALDPLAGVDRTPEETAAEVRRLLDEAGRARCATGYAEKIGLLGHEALMPLLAAIGDGDPEHPGESISCWAVRLLAEKEDVPAIRELVLAGKVNLVGALEGLQADGVGEATDALLDAAAAGRLDEVVTRALARAPDAARVIEVVNATIASRLEAAERYRANVADLFVKLDARESVPTIESWLATSREPRDLVAIADALVHFGNPKGVGVLVRIVSERKTRFPCRPSTPEEEEAASAPDRLCPEGFHDSTRGRAAQELSRIAGKEVFDVPEDWDRRLRDQGPGHESEGEYLDRAATAFRAWWAASKDRIRFDVESGRWTLGE